jgi:hypothetical protein
VFFLIQNALIYPALGLGAIVSKSRTLSPGMVRLPFLFPFTQTSLLFLVLSVIQLLPTNIFCFALFSFPHPAPSTSRCSQFAAGVQALAALSPALTDPGASLLPDLPEVRYVSVKVAAAVIKRAVEEGHSRVPELEGMNMDEIEERIKAMQWDPVYRPLELCD